MPKVHQAGANGNGRRRGRGAHVVSALAEINVVPLVDVMLVLLVIFMVTAPMMTQGLTVNLPQARRANPINVQPITITVPAAFNKSRIVQIGDEEIRVDILHERVKQALLPRPDKSVLVRADGSITVQDLVFVADKLKEGGVEKVAFSTRPPERAR
jgi:biopolymer transport protein ExbD